MADRYGNSATTSTRDTRKRRNQGDRRRFGDEPDRPVRVVVLTTDPRQPANRNPTRNIPDHPGFSQLTKVEIKNDTKLIDKKSSFAVPSDDVDEERDEDDAYGLIIRSQRPPCAPESTVARKKRRYIAWVAEPKSIQADLASYRNTIDRIQHEIKSLEADEERWLENFQIGRRKLTASLTACRKENFRLSQDAKKLQSLGTQEIALTTCNAVTRKKKSTFVRDVLDEMDSRQDTVADKIAEYEALVNSLQEERAQGAGVGVHIPTIHIEIDESSFPAPMHTKLQRSKSTEGNTQELATDGLVDGNIAESKEGDGMDVDPTAAESVLPSAVATERHSERPSRDRRPSLRMSSDESDLCAARDRDRNGHTVEAEEEEADSTTLRGLLAYVEQQLTQSQLSRGDIEPFFPDGPDMLSDPFAPYGLYGSAYSGRQQYGAGASKNATEAIATAQSELLNPFPGPDIESVIAAPYLQTTDPATWVQLIEQTCNPNAKENKDVPLAYSSGCITNNLIAAGLSSTSATSTVSSSMSLYQAANLTQRRKKRSLAPSSAIPLSSFVTSRTPRGVPLLISPLSHFCDRFIGSVSGTATGLKEGGVKDDYYYDLPSDEQRSLSGTLQASSHCENGAVSGSGEVNQERSSSHRGSDRSSCISSAISSSSISSSSSSSNSSSSSSTSNNSSSTFGYGTAPKVVDPFYCANSLNVPPLIRIKEDEALERLRLVSASLAAENKIRRLENSANEWKRLVDESASSLRKAEGVFCSAVHEHYEESRHRRKVLLHHGIAKTSAGDAPMSPLTAESFRWFNNPSGLASSSIAKPGINRQKFATSKSSKKSSKSAIFGQTSANTGLGMLLGALGVSTGSTSAFVGTAASAAVAASSSSAVANTAPVGASNRSSGARSTQSVPQAPSASTVTSEKGDRGDSPLMSSAAGGRGSRRSAAAPGVSVGALADLASAALGSGEGTQTSQASSGSSAGSQSKDHKDKVPVSGGAALGTSSASQVPIALPASTAGNAPSGGKGKGKASTTASATSSTRNSRRG